MAPSGQGQFVDVSNIPLAAVERVEILTDGASAIYGADAVAVVCEHHPTQEFRGRRDIADLRPGYLGRHPGGSTVTNGRDNLGSGNALVIADLHQRDPLDARDRSYIAAAGGGAAGRPDLPPAQQDGLAR